MYIYIYIYVCCLHYAISRSFWCVPCLDTHMCLLVRVTSVFSLCVPTYVSGTVVCSLCVCLLCVCPYIYIYIYILLHICPCIYKYTIICMPTYTYAYHSMYFQNSGNKFWKYILWCLHHGPYRVAKTHSMPSVAGHFPQKTH